MRAQPLQPPLPMPTGVQFPVPNRHASGQGRAALRFFVLSSGVFAVSIAIAVALGSLFGRPAVRTHFSMPPAFAVSTLLLIAGSVAMSKAVAAVRREKQRIFRHQLLVALAAGTLFMGVQAYGLWSLLPAERAAGDASTGATPIVLMFAALHALHLSVAVLGLAFITTRAHEDRYDHEYYWGVSVCAFFWHALGVAWLFVLAIVGFAAGYGVVM